MRFIAKIVIFSVCICAQDTNSLDETIEVLKKIDELERDHEIPFSVDEIFERMEAEGVDLVKTLEELGITKSDIESRQADNLLAIANFENALAQNPPVDIDINGDSFVSDEELLGAELIGSRGGSQINTASSLGQTSHLIMNMIFNMNGLSPMGTPPPMPVFVDSGPSWGSWKAWTSCTSSCGGGSRKRYRQCTKPRGNPTNCVGSQRQVSNCNSHDCPNQNNWAAWQSWGSCTKSCGVGQQIRRRWCKGSSCIGDTVQIQKCQSKACYSSAAHWNEWSSWSSCTRSCNNGFKGRIRRCSYGTTCSGEKSQSSMCNTQPCETKTNLVWQEWSSCSATCGTGIRRRERPCEYSPAKCRRFKLEESEQCYSGTPCGHWSIWRTWGSCTVSCGLGIKARIRKCIDGVPGSGGCIGSYEDTTGCNSQTCPTWTSWQPWSMCTATCGGGLQRRARYCRNGTTCPGSSSEERGCQTDECPRWTIWSNWSDCSTSCGSGTKRISRECLYGSVGQRGCFGSESLAYACNTQACARWASWSAFTDCSATCGGGRQAQHRECMGGVPGIECVGSHQNIETCNEEGCPYWSNWAEWTSCSVTCGRGFRSQDRRCSEPDKCDGEVENVQLCMGMSGTECPAWTDWSSYSSCSRTCGGGQKQRSRYCDAGEGMCGDDKRTERNGCNEQQCPYLTEWSAWSECSATCGSGSRLRARSCVEPSGGEGKCYATLNNEQVCAPQRCPAITTPKPPRSTTTRPRTMRSTTTRPTTTRLTTTRPTTTRSTTTRLTTTRHTTTRSTTTRLTTTRPTTTSSNFFTSINEAARFPISTTDGSMKEALDEMEKVLATADPERVSEECIVLNVEGDCLDHLEWVPGDRIVDIGNCNLPAFIMQNDIVSGTAELISETKVRYKCMDSWRIRGNKNMECRCRGNKCRPRPKQVPRCIPDIKGESDSTFGFDYGIYE